MRVLFLAQEALPVIFARSQCRQARVGARCEHRQPAGREVGDVPAVEVAHVERSLEVVRRVEELLRRVDFVGVEFAERELARRLAPARRTVDGDRIRRPAHGDRARDGPVNRFFEEHLVRRFGFAGTEFTGVDRLHRDAFAHVHVVVRGARRRAFVGVAEFLQELHRVLAARARQAPREVAPAPDEHVRRDRRDCTLGVDAAAVEVGLHHDLGVEVAELRPHHGQRVAVLGFAVADEQEVRHFPFRGTGLAGGLGRRGALRSGVDDRRAGGRPGRDGVVGERFARRRRRFGVVDLAQVAEDLEPFGRSEVALEAREQCGVGHFVAASVAEDRADEREAGDRVGDVDRRQQTLRRRHRGLVGVDAFDPVLQVLFDLFALRALFGQDFLLFGDVFDPFGARRERTVFKQQAERIDAGHAERGGVGRAEAEVQEQAAVLGGDPAGAEHHVGAGLAEDVRDVVAVAHDFKTGVAGFLGAQDWALDTELLRDEVFFKAFHADRLQRRQFVVQHGLIARVGARYEPTFLTRGENLERWPGQVDQRIGRRRAERKQKTTGQSPEHGSACSSRSKCCERARQSSPGCPHHASLTSR